MQVWESPAERCCEPWGRAGSASRASHCIGFEHRSTSSLLGKGGPALWDRGLWGAKWSNRPGSSSPKDGVQLCQVWGSEEASWKRGSLSWGHYVSFSTWKLQLAVWGSCSPAACGRLGSFPHPCWGWATPGPWYLLPLLVSLPTPTFLPQALQRGIGDLSRRGARGVRAQDFASLFPLLDIKHFKVFWFSPHISILTVWSFA